LAELNWKAGDILPASNAAVWTERRAAQVSLRGGSMAWGALSKAVLEAHEIADPVFAGEIVVDPLKLRDASRSKITFSAPSSFPRSIKDIAVVVPKTELAETARQRIATLAAEGVSGFNVESVRIFDVYEGEGLPENHKSIAFTVEYGSSERTLTEKEVGVAFDDLQSRIKADDLMQMR
jgi:phenylalanyl-tRNA synthetase beta chain